MKVGETEMSHLSGDYWKVGSGKESSNGSLFDYVKILKQKWRFIIGTALGVTLLAFLYTLIVTPMYRATGTVLVEPQRANIVDVKDGLEAVGRNDNRVQTQLRVIQNRSLIARVLEKTANVIDAEVAESDEIVDQYFDRLTASHIPSTNLIKISYLDENPENAANFVNLLAEEYINSDLESRREKLGEAAEILNKRLLLLQSALEESEQKLVDYKKTHGLLDLDNRLGKLDEQVLQAAITGQADATVTLERIKSERAAIAVAERTSGDLSSTVSAKQDPVLNSLYLQKRELFDNRVSLKTRYGDSHPRMIDINSRIGKLLAQIEDNERRLKITLTAELKAAEGAIAGFQQTIDSGKLNILGMGEKLQELEALEQFVATNRETYLNFLRSLQETNSTQGLEASIGRISEYAFAPTEPAKPSKTLILIGALLGSLVCASVLAIFRSLFGNTVNSLGRLEDVTNLRVIGYTPVKTDEPPEFIKPNSIEERSARMYGEAIRSIRSKLLVQPDSPKNKVLAITSTYPNEGKTTLALDLALSVGSVKKTLLIDCDLRMPSLNERFGLYDDTPGLTDLVRGIYPASECIYSNIIGDLDYLPSGQIVNEASELLLTRNFDFVIRKLAGKYSKIIIDTPPLTAVSDALVITRSVNSILLTVQVAGDTTFKAVVESVRQLRQADVAIEGIVATQVEEGALFDYDLHQDYAANYGYTGRLEDYRMQPAKDIMRLDNAMRMPVIDVEQQL